MTFCTRTLTALAISVFSVVSTAHAVSPTNALPLEAEQRFDTSSAFRHLSILSADNMRGRHTPSPELDRSAEYLADKFKAAGCEPIGGTYFHEYKLQLLDIKEPTMLTVVRGMDTLRCAVKLDFVPFVRTGEGAVNAGRVVFAGYGISAPELGYDDYANINVRGAVVVVIRGEPSTADSTKPFSGRGQTRYASSDVKMTTAMKLGAVAVFMVDTMRSGQTPRVFGAVWPSLYPDQGHEYNPVILGESEPAITFLSIGERPLKQIMGSTGELIRLRRQIDSTVAPCSRVIEDVTISSVVTLQRQHETVKNVMAILRGASKPHEYVIMGAHYDHVGVGKPVNGDSIFNGADDNASGTTALLIAAEALAPIAVRPERSIVFVAFSGEERGLLGSKSFAQHSPLPTDSCVAMINMDMIGRCESNKVSIGGDKYCPDLIAINEQENAVLQKPFTLSYDIERYFFRSDQANFARKKIPVIFYFTGEHGDYHKVTDEISKINLVDMVSITRLATRVAWRAANQPRTRYVTGGFEE